MNGNLAALDLVSVRLVVLCAQHGTLSKAAALAHLSISGASHRLNTMEARLGRRLFVRGPRGLHATPAGRELLPLAARLLQEAESFQLACCQNG